MQARDRIVAGVLSCSGPLLSRTLSRVCLTLLIAITGGCATIVGSLTTSLAEDLSATILDSNDPDTIRQGIPAYILMVDSFLRSDPDNVTLLMAASSLNGAFTEFAEGRQQQILAQKSLDYALAAACLEKRQFCSLNADPFDTYRQHIDGMQLASVPVFYQLGVAWTGWIQANSDDWAAIGQLDRVKILLTRVIELDENYADGNGHLYLGGLETLLPAGMGGHPEKGKRHFERAIAIADGRYLMAKVIYAERYARLVFDKNLHDRLLGEVLAANPNVPGMTLTNVVAQQRAAALLTESDEYF